MQGYDVYCEFDINKHAEKMFNYLEVVIDSAGKVYYAVPSHTMFLENILKFRWGEEKFRKEIECETAYNNYAEWLCEQTGCVLVWNDSIIYSRKRGLTEQQAETLKTLSKKSYSGFELKLYRGRLK